jgi:hypothetical protein
VSRTIVLDAGPLGLITNPKRTPETIAATQWAIDMMLAGHRLVVPAVADYEVRRELIRARKAKGLASLDAWNSARPDRFLSLRDSTLHLGAGLWARARQAGTPTADPKELDADVLVAAQALEIGVPEADIIVATVNVGHLARFVPADLWTNITP